MKNENKANVSIILSITALTLIIVLIILWCLNVKDSSIVTENTFIGTCTALISLALPIIVGYQIITSIDIKHSLKEGEEKFEKHKKEIEDYIAHFKVETTKNIDKIKNEFTTEIRNTQTINSELSNLLEVEKNERELLFQETKVAMYHGKVINNSAIALLEQIETIKLVIKLVKKEQLKEEIILLVRLIEDIHQTDFNDILSENKMIDGLRNRESFELNTYEKDIKIQLRNLPQISDGFTEALIWVEKALDCKMSFLREGAAGNADTTDSEIEKHLARIEEILS